MTTQAASAVGAAQSWGSATPTLVGPQQVSASGSSVSSGSALAATTYPYWSFDDFGIWDNSQPDSSVSRWVGGYATKPDWQGYTRVFGTVTAPKTFVTGNGDGYRAIPWAKYAAVGLRLNSVPAGESYYADAVQFERFKEQPASSLSVGCTATATSMTLSNVPSEWPAAPYYLVINRPGSGEIVKVNGYTAFNVLSVTRAQFGTTAVAHLANDTVNLAEVPGDYEDPRTVVVRMRADRVNYALNPSLQVDLTNFSAGTGVTMTRDTAVAQYGPASVKVVTASPSTNSYVLMSGVDLGTDMRYSWSTWVYSNVDTWLYGQFTGLWETGGQNRYLAVMDPNHFIPGGKWTRIGGTGITPFDWHTQTALVLRAARKSDNSGYDPSVPLWYSGFLIEAGGGGGDFFDGNTDSADYIWEGDANNSRTHYYMGLRSKAYRIQAMADDYLPVGTPINILYAQKPAELPYSGVDDSFVTSGTVGYGLSAYGDEAYGS